MNEVIKQILFYLVVILSNIIQCITGFAGTVLAMPFSLILMGYDTAKPVLNILGVLASIGVVAFNFKKINWKEFLKIALIMLPSMIIGTFLIKILVIPKNILYFILASIVYIFTILGIYTNFIKKKKEEKDNVVIDIITYIVLVLAGLVHGMFVCGGPLLIVYANRKLKERDEFRSTLSMVWIVLNSIIFFTDIANGYFALSVLPHMAHVSLISEICLVLALFIGDKIAKKLDKNVFLIVTYVLMFISATSLILNATGVL